MVASLVLHYLKDWKGPLAELRRVLKPGGRLILSVNHPTACMFNHPDADYFALTQYSEGFSFAGQQATLTFWHRPLPDITAAFIEAGFRIAVLSEPPSIRTRRANWWLISASTPRSSASRSSSSKRRDRPA